MINGAVEIEHDRESLELLYEVGREVATALDLQTVLERVLLLSMKHVCAVSGSIIVIDDIGQPAESAFSISGQAYDESALQLRVTFERGIAGWVARNREAVLIRDTSKDERWLHRPDDDTNRTGPKSAIIAPIQTSEGLVGVITLVHKKPGFFCLEHLNLLQAIADHAGAAIRNAQYFRTIKAAHKRYQILFDDSIDPILVTDLDGLILEVNRQTEKMFALNREKIIQTNIRDLINIDSQGNFPLVENLHSGEDLNIELELSVGERQRIPIQVYIRQIQERGNIQLQWILRDISARKKQDAIRDDLIAMVYHDLRSPLANIASTLEVLSGLLNHYQDESVHSLLAIASHSTERIQRLTGSLLNLYRLETGQRMDEFQLASPEKLISDAVEVIQPNAAWKGITLTRETIHNLPDIYVDPDSIVRVLINLLENAIKFTPTEGKIDVSARVNQSQVEFIVSDNGSGIPLADQIRIFDKFTRISPTDGPLGLGLGLTYCRLAVEAHGGEIWVESEPGRGSKFRFALPFCPVIL